MQLGQYENCNGQKFIKVDGSEVYKPVMDLYVYTYDGGNGKTVLRAKLDASIYTLDDIKQLFNGQCIYEYTAQSTDNVTLTGENSTGGGCVFILTNEFINYSKDLTCNYSAATNMWELEIGKKLDEEVLSEKNAEDLLNAYEAIIYLYEAR